MSQNDTAEETSEPSPTGGTDRRTAMRAATADATSPLRITRRGAIETTAGLSAAALGAAGGVAGTAAGGITEFETLTVSDDNRIVNEDGETVVLRGVNVPDPKRLRRTRHVRGKTPVQLIDLLTDPDRGWHPRCIRVPAQPQDIGEHPMGHRGPEYEDGELESPEAVRDDRRKMRPAQPVAFTREELLEYLEEYYDPVVERCRERGVYCIVDYHRHWHEQPPGLEDPSAAENHLPYDSEYTNYWAYNTFEHELASFGTDVPGSFLYVDQVTINELTPDYDGWTGLTGADELESMPYEYQYWQVNEELLEEALLFWDVVAQRYGDMDHVVFEAYNEPTSPAIWGPVDGCGAFKQKPLWDTYLDEFMGPILDKIREHQSEQVVLASVPGWCQSLQGLHWRSFADAGYENVAVTWHNYAGHDVSQVHNWLNDTDYQSPEAVEAETGQRLENPFLEPPTSVSDPDCWGWEGYEAAGLQNAMDYHPIVVSEFGWTGDADVHFGLRGSVTGVGTQLPAYGEPFLDAMESDDRISWIAWIADVRWLPRMFEFPDGPDEGELEDALVNDNYYDTPFEDLPRPCEEPPCEWALLDAPDSGEYVKQRLAALADDSVPLATAGDADAGCSDVGDRTVCDQTGDGLHRDVTADGSVGQTDVVEFFEGQHREAWKRPELFDYSGNGSVGHGDVVSLFEHVATQS